MYMYILTCDTNVSILHDNQVNDGIGDTKLVDKEMKSNSQLSILHKIWKIKRFNYNKNNNIIIIIIFIDYVF